MYQQQRQARGWHQHFIGSWARLNCENMPVIPAGLVRSNLNDPRRIPYLLVWKDERDGEIKEAVRLAHFTACGIEITFLRIVWRTLPRNEGRALFLMCPVCDAPRRFVYGWEWDSFSGWSNRVRQISWRCRSCARLRYSSEGGYLCPGTRFGAFGNLPRPDSWLPYVFTSMDDPHLDKIVRLNRF